METPERVPKPLETALAKQIRTELADHEMTQADLAHEMGISRGALSRYLNGHRTFEYGQIITIAETFGMEVSELVRRAELRLLR